jgi:hypothetical protein
VAGRPSSARGSSTGSKPGTRAPINKKKWSHFFELKFKDQYCECHLGVWLSEQQPKILPGHIKTQPQAIHKSKFLYPFFCPFSR